MLKIILVKMDFRNMSISSMFPSCSVYYDINKIKSLSENSIEPEPNKLVWFKDKPQIIDLIDKHMRKTFNVPEQSKLIFTMYKPPRPKDPEVVIKKCKHRLSHRIIMSTIRESPTVELMGKKSEKMKMTNGVAYSIPFPVNGMAEVTFDNKHNFVIPPRKGFRQQRMTKKIENRYILMFDYTYTDEITQAVKEVTGKEENLNDYSE